MRDTTVHLEPFRVDGFGMNGRVRLTCETSHRVLWIQSSDGEGWEHVSVSVLDDQTLCPTWAEMHWVKRQFWKDTETVLQIHPPQCEYVKGKDIEVLHLWRQIDKEFCLPDRSLL